MKDENEWKIVAERKDTLQQKIVTERAEPYRGTRFDLLREESTDQSQEEFPDLKSEIVDNENKIKVTKMHRMPKKESQMIRKAASRKDTCWENDKNSEGGGQ